MRERPVARWRRFIEGFAPTRLGARLAAGVVLLAAVISLVTVGIDALVLRSLARGVDIGPDAFALATISTIVASLTAAGVGAVFSLLLVRIGREPVEHLIERIDDAGTRVLDGEPYARGQLEPDSRLLPIEFVHLADVIDRVLGRLAGKQAKLRESVALATAAQEALQAVVNGSLDPLVLLEGSTVVFANTAAGLAFGSSPDALRGANIREALSGVTLLDEDGTVADQDAVFARALDGPVTLVVERPGAGPASYVVRATRPTESMPERVLFACRDVTEDLRVQQIRSEIIELVSHDLRAPLAVVTGYLDVLHQAASADERTRAARAAKREAARMSDLLEDLLSAAKAEELLAPAELELLGLDALAKEVVQSMAAAHPERDVRVDAPCGSRVLGDEKRLRQAVVNLVANALRCSPRDAPVTVRVACDDTLVDLEVIDHGPGVPADQRDHVFERYGRLDPASGPRPGLGLGLYIVRVITENHGGRASVTDTPGGGATFVMRLPLAPPVEATAAQ